MPLQPLGAGPASRVSEGPSGQAELHIVPQVVPMFDAPLPQLAIDACQAHPAGRPCSSVQVCALLAVRNLCSDARWATAVWLLRATSGAEENRTCMRQQVADHWRAQLCSTPVRTNKQLDDLQPEFVIELQQSRHALLRHMA